MQTNYEERQQCDPSHCADHETSRDSDPNARHPVCAQDRECGDANRATKVPVEEPSTASEAEADAFIFVGAIKSRLLWTAISPD